MAITREKIKIVFPFLGLLAALGMSMLSISASAAEENEEKKEERENYIVGKWAYGRLSKSHEAIGKKQYKEALSLLDDMMQRRNLNDHERAMMWQTFGFVWSSLEKFPKAVEAFEKCLALDAMPKGAETEIRFNLAQLYLATKSYKKAIDTFKQWLALVENPTPSSYYLVAMAYAQSKKFRNALYYAEKAIEDTKKPQQSWYQFALSLQFRLKQYESVARTLEILVTNFPKKTYWLQLAAIYGQMKREKESLAVMELAYLQGMLNKDTELVNFASLYMFKGVPFKAAQVIEKGIKDGIIKKEAKPLRMISEAWLNAREVERALNPLKDAAKLLENGDLYVQLAQIYINREDWAKATKYLNQAFKKGNLTDPGTTYLLLGITKQNQDQYPAAIAAFSKAAEHKKTKKSAEQWIKIVKAKQKNA